MQPAPEIKILVVDDREDNLFSIETILERDDYVIIKANSGRAALKILLQQHDFSLILMDVQMPGMNGFETAALIYERDKLRNIPIIFITAHSYEDEFIFKGYETGGVDYIYKPVNPELLKVKVGIFVELYRKNQQLQMHERKLLASNAFLQKEIEERKISEEKIRDLNQQLIKNNIHLKEVNEELDRFAFVASHDLQEPLRKIRVFTDMILQKSSYTEEVDRYMKKIIESSNRMQQLINDILQFSRHHIDTNDFEETDLNILLKEAVAELEIKITETQAQVNIQNLPTIAVIPGLMRQLFYNLISNGIKFSKNGTPPVINICAIKKEGLGNDFAGFHRIEISDNGIGFDDKYADEIFMVFKRLHSYHEFEGTGMGLAICKKIVEKHNGYITASSKIGKGATFTVGLPGTPVTLVPAEHYTALIKL